MSRYYNRKNNKKKFTNTKFYKTGSKILVVLLMLGVVGSLVSVLDSFFMKNDEDVTRVPEEVNHYVIFEDFENQNIETITNFISFSNLHEDFPVIVESENYSNKSLEVKPLTESLFLQFQNNVYDFKNLNLLDFKGVTITVKVSDSIAGASLKYKIGSYLNTYIAEIRLDNIPVNEYVEIMIPFTDFVLEEGSYGLLDFGKFNTYQMFIKNYNGYVLSIDNVGFYK